MGTTPHTIVDATYDALDTTPVVFPFALGLHKWRLEPIPDAALPAIAILCSQCSDAPASRTVGAARWTRTATLSVVAVLARASTDESAGYYAAGVQEAILDALFGSETWCNLWLGTPAVECVIDADRSAEGRRVAVGITIRGEHNVSRAYDDPGVSVQTVTYENDEDGGGEYHGITVAP